MKEQTRREFLGRAFSGVAVAGAGLRALGPVISSTGEPQQPPAMARDRRSYVAGRYGLELDGQFAGWIESVEGGHATADVVVEKMGPDRIQHKHIAGLKYEDITVNVGTGMSKGFYDWIKASLDKQSIRRNGAIVVCDFDYRPVSRMQWFNALISEVGFPACDAASKDAAKMTIKITPEYTRMVQGQTGSAYPPNRIAPALQKKWLPANFRLQIAGCQTACSRVNKIEAITVKTVIDVKAVGELRNYPAVPPHLDIPNLTVTTSEAVAAEFYQWHEDFVIKGNNGNDKERGGTLEFITPDLRESIFTLTFRNLGIFKLTPEKVEAGSENILRVIAEMYCEDISFAYGSAAWA
jgi:phage tail-like protein